MTVREHISVVIPTCDRKQALMTCLTSLSAGQQTLPADRYEIIVTDDGSQPVDPNDFLHLHPFLKFTRGPRRGPAANRNHGASTARGRYLAFIDDDCIASAQWLSSLAACAEEGAKVVEGRTTTDYPLNGPFFHAPINESGGYLWSCNFLIERQLFQTLGGFDERFPYPFMEDVDFRTTLLEAGQQFVFAKDAVVTHPQRPVAAATSYARQFESYFAFSQKHRVSLFQSGLSPAIWGRIWAKMLLKSRSLSEAARVILYVVTVCLTLMYLMPGWARKYRPD